MLDKINESKEKPERRKVTSEDFLALAKEAEELRSTLETKKEEKVKIDSIAYELSEDIEELQSDIKQLEAKAGYMVRTGEAL